MCFFKIFTPGLRPYDSKTYLVSPTAHTCTRLRQLSIIIAVVVGRNDISTELFYTYYTPLPIDVCIGRLKKIDNCERTGWRRIISTDKILRSF